MDRHPVVSSFISYVGWEDRELEVGFTNGEVWIYFGVPKAVFEVLIQAESTGKAFHQYVKDAFYAGRKIE